MDRTLRGISIGILALVLPSVAVAADLGGRRGSIKDQPSPVYQAPPAYAAEPFNWSGAYAGVFLGGASEGWAVDFYRNNNHGHADISANGLAYGGWIGYNMMLDRNFVVGIEADLGKANGEQMNNIFDNDTSYSSIGTFGTVRGRFGYALDNLMVYATAGLAYASITNDIQKGKNAGEEIVWDDKWDMGYAIGGGLEYAFTKNLLGRVEYIYSNYGMVSLTNRDGNLTEMTNDMHLVRAGLSYKF